MEVRTSRLDDWARGDLVLLLPSLGRGLESQRSFLRLRRGGWLGVFERDVLKEH